MLLLSPRRQWSLWTMNRLDIWDSTTICHHGSPIRAPKQRYIPHFQPLSKLLQYLFLIFSQNCHMKLFLSQPTLKYINHLSPSEPPISDTYPCSNTIFLSHFLSSFNIFCLNGGSGLPWNISATYFFLFQFLFPARISQKWKRLLKHTLTTMLKEIHNWLNFFCHLKEELGLYQGKTYVRLRCE